MEAANAMSWVPIRICDSCDKEIKPGAPVVSYPLALSCSIDLHEECAEKEPSKGFTTELAKKARNRNNT